MHIGWAVVWNWPGYSRPAVRSYLQGIGFRYAYQADGAAVYRLRA
jgi:hypothetical protein